MNIYDTVEEILVKELGKKKKDINMDANLRYDLGMNSLELAQLAVLIEDGFDILVDDGEIAQINTIQNICNVIKAELDKIK